MSRASSSRTSANQWAPYIPLITCPDCGQVVKRRTSQTPLHPGWVFFKCEKHARGCNFFHWELQYVIYLLDNNILYGQQGLEAIGWAEDRRLELEMRKEEAAATSPSEELRMIKDLVALMKEAIFLLKIVLAVLGGVFLLLIVKK